MAAARDASTRGNICLEYNLVQVLSLIPVFYPTTTRASIHK